MTSQNQPLASTALEGVAEAGNLTYFAFLEQPQEPPQPTAAETEPLPPLPDVLGGRYRLERMIGVGGMGAVYRARDLLREQFGDPDPHVAVKLLNDEFAEHCDASALLYSEFALTTRLRHPHIVRLHSFEMDIACRRAFITLELMRGLTLDQLLCERPQGLPWNECRDIALALLDALAYSHQRGVLHGDLKPSNVMLADDGPRLFDYGLGQAQEGLLEGLPRLSRERFSAWTPRYAALELLDGAPLSPASDLFAVACVLHELASGHHPYRRLNARQAKAMQLEAQLKAPDQLPAPTWQALRTALALEESRRHITAAELRKAFLAQPARRFSHWFQRRKG
ncbi:serine/threonine protein kinase [Pseudomonas sp. ZM23]|uniref:Serine/threonine-protein kinase n=1 Tax=Pseudomonas triclosanedens TaxID=2961893 RepID=A0ABY7A059_9PSED|nr:serine/threonine-protein kinase [Pseudomonas triclosanedens]MCP8464006.1 serine/threonine protein kinase [Pseudomonas triclosanedens]MCP8469090.1 serine/threonine protein kinase [Pseudomonas triclosanedens]MCP8475812.1 serine/threonine protein kinase [Pseudomonas triclosanedens]WAI50483.1 serine/threonine-protein kinase [Pseudomonas triclosanedens]